jgi:hypothetical protein
MKSWAKNAEMETFGCFCHTFVSTTRMINISHFAACFINKKVFQSWVQWLTPVIPVTWEGEIRKIVV